MDVVYVKYVLKKVMCYFHGNLFTSSLFLIWDQEQGKGHCHIKLKAIGKPLSQTQFICLTNLTHSLLFCNQNIHHLLSRRVMSAMNVCILVRVLSLCTIIPLLILWVNKECV